MSRTESKVEKSRVTAHESAESGVAKIHTLIDKVAEQAETGSERATELGAAASARSQDLRSQAADASKSARKDAKKSGKKLRKNAKKAGKKAGSNASDLRDTVVGTASGLAAAGKDLADEAGKRAPEAFSALKDDHDAQAALAAIKGESRRSGRGWKVLLLALVAGGVAFYLAKKKQQPKKDPWAVPAGDPYRAPETGRDSSITPAATGVAASETPIADEVVADEVVSTDDVPVPGAAPALGEGDTTHAAMTGHPDGVDDPDAPLSAGTAADTTSSTGTSSTTATSGATGTTGTSGTDGGLGETRPLSNDEIDELASDDPTAAHVGQPDETAATGGQQGDQQEGGDAWSSARDWADDSQDDRRA